MFAHPQSCVCGKSELDIFAVPPTQTSIEDSQFVDYRPISTLTDSGPIEFSIPGSDQYLDLNDSLLYLKIKITKEDGSAIDDSGKVSPVNHLLNSLFQQVDVSLGTTTISPSTNTYTYVSYIASLLGAPKSAKLSSLQAALWSKDEAGEMDQPNPSRAHAFKSSTEVQLMGKIYPDLFRQGLLLLNGIDLKLRFIRNKDAFCLMSGDSTVTPKIRMLDAALFVRKVKLSPQVLEAHARALEIGNAKYGLARMECKTFAVAQGSYSADIDNAFQGALPRRIVIACVDGDSFNGNFQKNPFNFKHYDISFLCLHVDGNQIPAKALQPQFDKKLFARSYLSLFSGTGQLGGETAIDISQDEYPKGFTLFAFNLTPDLSEGCLSSGHMNLVRRGSLRVEIKFRTPLAQPITVLLFAESDSILEIDRNRQVLVDF